MGSTHPFSPSGALPSERRSICERILASPGVVLVLGGPDSGKTTWVTAAARLLASQARVAVVDTDIGQSSLGPPACVSAARVPDETWVPGRARPDLLAFVGSVSPMGHALQLVTAAHRVVRRIREQADIVLVDTSGLISPGFGFQVKLRKVELLEPRHAVVFERGEELSALRAVLACRASLMLHPLRVGPSIRRRSAAERAAWRTARWAWYFDHAPPYVLDLHQTLVLRPVLRGSTLEQAADVLACDTLRTLDLRGLLAGLCGGEGETLALGVCEGLTEGGLRVRAPLVHPEAVRLIQLGRARWDQQAPLTAPASARSGVGGGPGRRDARGSVRS